MQFKSELKGELAGPYVILPLVLGEEQICHLPLFRIKSCMEYPWLSIALNITVAKLDYICALLL